MANNIEDMVSQTYVDFRKYNDNGYSLLKSNYNGNEAYAEIAPTPSSWASGTPRAANWDSRTKVFSKFISDYLKSGLDGIAASQNSLVRSYTANNIFRSRITFSSDNFDVYFWVPKFSWLFGNRIRMKYKVKKPLAKGEETNIFSKLVNLYKRTNPLSGLDSRYAKTSPASDASSQSEKSYSVQSEGSQGFQMRPSDGYSGKKEVLKFQPLRA